MKQTAQLSCSRLVFTGSFIYVNHSLMVRPGDRAILYSKDIPATAEGDCLSFWYHHKGSSTLRVWERVGSDLVGPYWESQPGGLLNVWMHDRVTLKATAAFQVCVCVCVCVYHHKGSSTLRVWERVGSDLVGPYWESQPGGLLNVWMHNRVTLKATAAFPGRCVCVCVPPQGV